MGSSGYYAESSEILNKQRLQRIRPSVPVQGFNIVGGGLNIKPKLGPSNTEGRSKSSNASNKSDRRMDSNEEAPLESVDFEDLSSEKNNLKGQNKKVITNIDDNSNDNESQITAETASFVSSGKHNKNFNYNQQENNRKAAENRNRSKASNKNVAVQSKTSYKSEAASGFKTQSQADSKSNNRGQQRYKEEKKTSVESLEHAAVSAENGEGNKRNGLPEKIVLADKPSKTNSISFNKKTQFLDATTTPKSKYTTSYYPSGTYSTARRFESNTRTTPYYTPTVPSVLSKTKSTEDHKSQVKGNKSSNGSGNVSATTPAIPRKQAASSGFSLESSPAPSTFSPLITTIRPFIIGMRHHSSSETSRAQQQNEVFSTTTPAPTGPTYLPKSAASPKAKVSEAAGDDLQLFAPIPTGDAAVSRNVNEMLKTMSLINHKLEDVEHIKPTSGREGLEIPPSSGPDALISLAKYFAAEHNGSALNSLSEKEKQKDLKGSVSKQQSGSKLSDSTVSITTESSIQLSENSDDIKNSLLSNKTINKYNNLFGLSKATESVQIKTLDNSKAIANDTYQIFPQIGTTDATINQLVEKPESRNIASVFSNALSNYLDDPEKFRQKLISVRPTEPPAKKDFEIITEAALFKGGTAASYLPNRIETTTQANIASEINSKFDYSTALPDFSSTTEDVYDSTTTYRSSVESAERKNNKSDVEGSVEAGGAGGEEFLQRGESQSFVKPRNELTTKSEKKKISQINAAYVKPTENPWTQIAQTDFLDPLTINDGLMKDYKSTTMPSAYSFLPRETTTSTPPRTTKAHFVQKQSNYKYQGSAEVTTARTKTEDARKHYRAEQGTADNQSWHDIFTTYDIPRDTLPSSSGLQRIANKLFGGLNESEALHLKNVMQQAEHNRQVLSLLLLLIQTCDDHNGKALERSRKHLLNALIDMDGKLVQAGKSTHHKLNNNSKQASSTALPAVTTFRRSSSEEVSTLVYPSTTTDLPATSTEAAISEETTKFEIRVEDPEDQTTDSSQSASILQSKTTIPDSSDKRALELLKSLYSLASKFTSRR